MSKFRLRGKKQKKNNKREIPIQRIIPNMLTFMAAAFGITSIRYSCAGDWKRAAVYILISCFLDGIDGRVARLLRATSKLGAELDSLSDFVSFGVAPAMLLYFWIMQTVVPGSAYHAYRGIFWGLSLFYALCCGFRLARFNIMIEDGPTQPYWKHFFLGLPAPGGAGLVMLPLVIYFITDAGICLNPVLCAFSLLICGILLAGRIPTLSAKHLRVPRVWMFPFILLVILIVCVFVARPWIALAIIGTIYYLSIPICGCLFLRMKCRYENSLGNSLPRERTRQGD